MSEFSDEFKRVLADAGQDQQLAHHRKHIQVLWNHIERLEKLITIHRDDSISIGVGQASVTLKKNGDVTIKGNNIEISGMGRVNIKGAKIAQN